MQEHDVTSIILYVATLTPFYMNNHSHQICQFAELQPRKP